MCDGSNLGSQHSSARRQRQEGLCEFRVTLFYKGSSKPARATQRNWIELETGILGEVIQTQRGKHPRFSLICVCQL